jgi:hypothetical protein
MSTRVNTNSHARHIGFGMAQLASLWSFLCHLPISLTKADWYDIIYLKIQHVLMAAESGCVIGRSWPGVGADASSSHRAQSFDTSLWLLRMSSRTNSLLIQQ